MNGGGRRLPLFSAGLHRRTTMKIEFKKAREEHPVSDINVTPLVDIMLVLLIIFMVITPMLQHGIQVDLARAQNPRLMPDAEKEDATTVAISRDGRIYLGTRQIAIDEITPKVKDLLSAKPLD